MLLAQSAPTVQMPSLWDAFVTALPDILHAAHVLAPLFAIAAGAWLLSKALRT